MSIPDEPTQAGGPQDPKPGEKKVEKAEMKEPIKENKEGKLELKEKPEKEFKENKLENKEFKLENKELKPEAEKPLTNEGVKPDEGGVKPDEGGGAPPVDLGVLTRHAEALEAAARNLRHFIEESERPDLSRGALGNEGDGGAEPAGGASQEGDS